MAKPMTKSATIAHLAQKTGLAKKQVVDLFEQLEGLAIKEAKNIFVLPYFGRLGYNPSLSETTAVIRSGRIVHPQP